MKVNPSAPSGNPPDRERLRGRVRWVNKLVRSHLTALALVIPRGTRERAVRGAATVMRVILALQVAHTARIRDLEGTALEILAELRARGYLVIHRLPCAVTAGATLAMLARLTPLVVQIRHGRYRVLLQAHRGAEIHADYLAAVERLQHVRDWAPNAYADATRADQKALDLQAETDPSEAPITPGPLTALSEVEDERARATTAPGDGRDGGGDAVDPAVGSPGAAPSSPAPPVREDAEGGRGASSTRPRVGGEPLFWTASSWQAAVQIGKHVQRVALLALDHLPAEGFAGDARALGSQLAGHAGLTGRDRERLIRAVGSAGRRGILTFDGRTWRIPDLRLHPDLERLDLGEDPTPDPPAPGIRIRLERAGVRTAGLGSREAARIHRRLWSRARAGMPSVRELRRAEDVMGEHGPARRALGRLDRAALAAAVQRAHADRRWLAEVGHGW